MLGPEGDVRAAADHGPGDCALTNLNAASPETLPPGRKRNGTPTEDDRAGLTTLVIGILCSKFSTPHAGRKRDSGKGRWGRVKALDIAVE